MSNILDELLIDSMKPNSSFFEKIKELFIILFLPCSPSRKIVFYIRLRQFFKKHRLWILAKFIDNKIYYKFYCQISQDAVIGPRVKFPHPIGIVIGNGVVIDEDVVIYQNVTLGRKIREKDAYPHIKRNVVIYANSVIIGDVDIEKNTVIAANSVVTKSTEENSTYGGSPARRLK